MILHDREIRRRCQLEDLVVPYLKENIQPASIDLRLGHEFVVFDSEAEPLKVVDRRFDDLEFARTRSMEVSHHTLYPGEFILGVTQERVEMPDNLVGRVEGKSSLGRLGLAVHVTAGFIDPGFCGPITLEFANLGNRPLILDAGMLICQLSFHLMPEPAEQPYRGRYQNAQGVEASKYGSDE